MKQGSISGGQKKVGPSSHVAGDCSATFRTSCDDSDCTVREAFCPQWDCSASSKAVCQSQTRTECWHGREQHPKTVTAKVSEGAPVASPLLSVGQQSLESVILPSPPHSVRFA
jgi:hypothetical protein